MALEHIKKKLSEQPKPKPRQHTHTATRAINRKVTLMHLNKEVEHENTWAAKEAGENEEFNPRLPISPENNPYMEDGMIEYDPYSDQNNPLYGLRVRDSSLDLPPEALRGLHISLY